MVKKETHLILPFVYVHLFLLNIHVQSNLFIMNTGVKRSWLPWANDIPKYTLAYKYIMYITKHTSGYIKQTLYTWWSLKCSGQPLQHLMSYKISLFSHLIDHFPEFMNSTCAVDRLLTMLLLHTDLLIQIRIFHAKVSLSSPTQTNDSHHFYIHQVVSNRRKSGTSQWCPTSLNQRHSFPHEGWERLM